MFSNNLGAFVEHFWNKAAKSFQLDLTNVILKGCVVTHAGQVCNEVIQNTYAEKTA